MRAKRNFFSREESVINGIKRIHAAAGEADHFAIGSVKFQDFLISRFLVKAVDILGNHADEFSLFLKPGNRKVSRVGPGLPHLGVHFFFAPPIFPAFFFIGKKLLNCNRPKSVPNPAFGAVVRDAAFGGDSSTGKDDDPGAFLNEAAEPFDFIWDWVGHLL